MLKIGKLKVLRGRRSQCILNGGWRCKQYNAFLFYKLKNSYRFGFWRLERALKINV